MLLEEQPKASCGSDEFRRTVWVKFCSVGEGPLVADSSLIPAQHDRPLQSGRTRSLVEGRLRALGGLMNCCRIVGTHLSDSRVPGSKLSKGWVQQIDATTLALDLRSGWWMLSAVPCKKSGLSVSTVHAAVPALIADIVKPESQSGGVVELPDRAPLIVERADLRIAALRKQLNQDR